MREKFVRPGRRASAAGRIALLGLVLSGAAFGCSRSRTAPFTSQADARINIEVINYGFDDITLHALWSGKRVRLGRVSGTQTGNFMLPWDWTDQLRIRIDVLAGGECTTRGIWTDPGDHILLEIQSHLRYCGLY